MSNIIDNISLIKDLIKYYDSSILLKYNLKNNIFFTIILLFI